MKNIIKMSLVAAVAVAGLSSTVAAKPLEESIKDVDFSGSLRYRYTNGESVTPDSNDYRLQVVTKAKVNDNVTAKLALNSRNQTSDNNSGTNDGDLDPNAANIAEANFIFKAADATIIAGKQALATPFADGGLDSQQGTGIVAMYPVGPVTLAAGYYINSDAKIESDYAAKLGQTTDVDLGSNNITAIGAIGAAGPVNYAVWYANVSESSENTGANNANTLNIAAGANAFNVNVDGTFGPVSVEFNYAKIDYTASANNAAGNAAATLVENYDPTQTRVVATFDAEVAKISAGIVRAGKDGADVTLGDSDASSNFAMEAFTAVALRDTTAYYLGVKAPVGPVSLGLEHGRTSDVDGTTAGDVAFSETKLSASYAMSKNFTISGWVTETSGDDVVGGTAWSKQGATRLQLNYTF